MITKPTREQFDSLVEYAAAMHKYFEEMRYGALADIRAIDRADNSRRSASRCIAKPIPTRETEGERISIHEKAQSNPILRNLLKNMEIKW